MRRFQARALLAAVAVALSCGTLTAQDAVNLRYKLAKGDKLIYRTRSEVAQTQEVAGMKLENKMDMEQWVIRGVDKVGSDGALHLTSETKRLKAALSFGQLGEYKFDSETGEADKSSQVGAAVTPLFERLAGATFQAVISPVGKVTKVEGYKELLADVLKDNPLAAQFAGGGSNEAALMEVQQNFPVLSAKALKPGDSWEVPHDIEMPGIGHFSGKERLTYVGPDKVGEHATAKIQSTADVTITIDIDMPTAQVTGTIKTALSSGTIQFDVARGRVLSVQSDATLAGDLTVTAGGNMISIHQEQSHKVSAKLLDKLP